MTGIIINGTTVPGPQRTPIEISAFTPNVKPMLESGSSEQVNPMFVTDGSITKLEKWSPSRYKNARWVTTSLMCLTYMMERMDEQIVPALFSELGKKFSASPSQLGYLTLSRTLCQALSSILGGVLGHKYNRIFVTSCGCFLWGTMTCAFAYSNTLTMGVVFSAINGIGLALVIPNSQSCTADYWSKRRRGLAFGALHVTSGIGAMAGALYATNLGNRIVASLPGWRFVFLTSASISFFVGMLALSLGREPRKVINEKTGTSVAPSNPVSLNMIPSEIKKVFRVRSFLIIILQGTIGTIPNGSLVFLTLYFQLMGIKNMEASILTALWLMSNAIGGFIGGWIGDWASIRWPNKGRIVVCQLSISMTIPFSILITKVIPHDNERGTVVAYAAVIVICCLLNSWAAPACNNPIFSEIVPVHLRTLVFSLDRAFEGALAAGAVPLVGLLAEKMFGFHGVASPSGNLELDRQQAAAVGNALLGFMIVPTILCIFIYFGLYFTYPKDRSTVEKDEDSSLIIRSDVVSAI